MDSSIALFFVSIIIMITGIIGIIVPMLPGVPLEWGGLFIYAYTTHFTQISVRAVTIFFILALLTLVIDIAGPALGTKHKKASRYGVWGAIIGGLLGIWVFGPLGIILGPYLGAFLGELIGGKTFEQGARASWGALLGFLGGTFVKLVIGFSMMIYFLAALIF